MMKRDLLRQLFRGALVAALPLGACAPPSFPPRDASALFDANRGDGMGRCLPSTHVDAILDGGIDDAGCDNLCIAAAQQQGGPQFGSQSLVLACAANVNDGGALAVDCDVIPYCVGGRRPAGLRDIESSNDGEIGEYFARAAHLEAASIVAFRRLRSELRHQRAPAALLDGATRAASDEIRHARVLGALARARGAKPRALAIAPVARRSLLALAIENAREGCIRESFGALTAAWQSRAAVDPELRAAMRPIADDELRHAELAWSIRDWCASRLDPRERAQVSAALDDERARLRTEARRELPPTLRHQLGLPTPQIAEALLNHLT